MSIKQVRLSNQAKEQLIRLKTRTGIQQWNILCRWALCLSLKELTPPASRSKGITQQERDSRVAVATVSSPIWPPGSSTSITSMPGEFVPALDTASADRRRDALAKHARLTREIVSLRSRATRETQLNRRVEMNLQLKQLETRLTAVADLL